MLHYDARIAIFIVFFFQRRVHPNPCFTNTASQRGLARPYFIKHHVTKVKVFSTERLHDDDRKEGFHSVGTGIDRKEAIQKVITSTFFNYSYLFGYLNNEGRAEDLVRNDVLIGLGENELSTMKYKKILGEGAFKKVYSISYLNGEQAEYLALAVERLKSKSEARDEIRGVKIAEHLQKMLRNSPDSRFFESIEDWWIQTLPHTRFEADRLVFEDAKKILNERTRRKPTSFVGKNWYLLSFKPLYDMDLKRFSKACTMYPILDERDIICRKTVAGIDLNSSGAFNLLYELCHAGRILHDDLGIIHRDIKPKNIMLKDRHVVIIDFGFAGAGSLEGSKLCITEVGKVKGELNYVFAEDVPKYRGCKEGDTYAMGRTIYEVLFEPSLGSTNSSPKEITFERAKAENERFLSTIDACTPTTCRFEITATERDQILTVVKGLCRSQWSFGKAEKFIENTMII